ncbi:PREDICTED: uncharacterized protein LOC108356104, partial [Rhagoletis zephyria]|uniref:uncharacterized protein LOC108356104 n=1 Tax=Rhagoletis zephyria TaxID=28612 RepID=UPI000811617C
SEYGMHRQFIDHTQPPPNQNNDVNFMASTAAAAAVAAASAQLNTAPNNTNEYDKFVDIVKNIVDNHKATPDKVDTFGDFIKSYMRRWPDRLQDEAINHITNYVIVKNMENSMNNGGDSVNNRQ